MELDEPVLLDDVPDEEELRVPVEGPVELNIDPEPKPLPVEPVEPVVRVCAVAELEQRRISEIVASFRM